MPVKIRLRRMGRKKKPHYRVVVADSASPRDGRFVEALGYYKPLSHPARLVLDLERVDHWLGEGAEPSGTVKSLISRARRGGDETVAVGEVDPEERKAKRAEELAARRAAEKKAKEEVASAAAEAKAAEAKAAEVAEEEAAAAEEADGEEAPTEEPEAAAEPEAEAASDDARSASADSDETPAEEPEAAAEPEAEAAEEEAEEKSE